jgi:hypothetical protein
MLVSEEEEVEVSLLRYAQQEAARWGAARFRAEFERRDEEERRLLEAEGRNYGLPSALRAPERPTSAPELIDESVREHAVAGPRTEPEFRRPKQIRHPHVPRPPVNSDAAGRRGRRRQRERPSDDEMWMPSSAEIARMSPAGRRLYGIED